MQLVKAKAFVLTCTPRPDLMASSSNCTPPWNFVAPVAATDSTYYLLGRYDIGIPIYSFRPEQLSERHLRRDL